MGNIAFVTCVESQDKDFDMGPLLAACQEIGLLVDVHDWDDPGIDWSRYGSVVLRSPWDYADRLDDFLAWCEHVSEITNLCNPLPAIRWNLDKSYLGDLERLRVPIVPTLFLGEDASATGAIEAFLSEHDSQHGFVVKPTIGCYSRGVRRFDRRRTTEAKQYVSELLCHRSKVMLQPYISSIDTHGETDIITFDGVYSYAVRKGALLAEDGTVNVPSYDFRSSREADVDERAVAEAAIAAAMEHLALNRPLLYGRVDLVRGASGEPLLLELEIAEPSLSLPLVRGSARRFAESISRFVEATT